jgi:hypothetical protein
MRGTFSHEKNFENVLADNRPYLNKYVSARTAIAAFSKKRNIFLGGIGFYVFCGSCIGNVVLRRAFTTAGQACAEADRSQISHVCGIEASIAIERASSPDSALKNSKIVVNGKTSDGKEVRTFDVALPYDKLFLDQGPVFLQGSHMSACFQFSEKPSRRMRVIPGEQNINHDECPLRVQQGFHFLQFFRQGSIVDMMETAIGHYEVEGTLLLQFLPRIRKPAPIIQAACIGYQPAVDIIAMIEAACLCAHAREKCRATAKVENLSSRGQLQGSKQTEQIVPLFLLVESQQSLQDIIE